MAAPLNIAVVLGEERDVYIEFDSAFREAMTAYPDVRVVPSPAAQHVDLVVAVGPKAAARFADYPRPVMNVMVSRASMAAIQRPVGLAASDIYLDQPLTRQLLLLRAAVPEARRVGVIYSQASTEQSSLRQSMIDQGLQLFAQRISGPEQISSGLATVLENSDVMLVLPDALVYRSDTIRNILLQTYRRRVPVIGLSQNYVHAGALCAVYSTPAQVARQAAELLVQFSRTGKLPKYQFPREFEVAVNKQVARSLGLMVKSAEQMRMEIEGRP